MDSGQRKRLRRMLAAAVVVWGVVALLLFANNAWRPAAWHTTPGGPTPITAHPVSSADLTGRHGAMEHRTFKVYRTSWLDEYEHKRVWHNVSTPVTKSHEPIQLQLSIGEPVAVFVSPFYRAGIVAAFVGDLIRVRYIDAAGDVHVRAFVASGVYPCPKDAELIPDLHMGGEIHGTHTDLLERKG